MRWRKLNKTTMKDIEKMIKDSQKIAEKTQQKLTDYLDEVGKPDRRGVIETDKHAKALEQASLNAQRTVTFLGKLLED